jgi:type VI secretion system protein
MNELTMLERIEALESKKSGIKENPVDIEKRSVMKHLRKLLNTSKGSVQIAPDLGMPDMTSFSGDGLSETILEIEKAVLEVVKKYEKRLSNVKVTVETDKTDVLIIHFSLEGVLSRHENVPVLFRTFMKPGGNINIE